MKASVRGSALVTGQETYEKLTNSGVNLYSGGIVSSRSPAFFSFFSLAFTLKRKNKKNHLEKLKLKVGSTSLSRFFSLLFEEVLALDKIIPYIKILKFLNLFQSNFCDKIIMA